jgi:hypothetical protein
MFINGIQAQQFILEDLLKKSALSDDVKKYIISKYLYEFLAGRTQWHPTVKHTIPTAAVKCYVQHDKLCCKCKNNGRQDMQATKFCVVAPSVCQSSVGNLFHVTLMGSRILNF